MINEEVKMLRSRIVEKLLADRGVLVSSIDEENSIDQHILVRLLEAVRNGRVITYDVDNTSKTLNIYSKRTLSDEQFTNEVYNRCETIVKEIDRLMDINTMIYENYLNSTLDSECYYLDIISDNNKLIEKIKKQLTIYVS